MNTYDRTAEFPEKDHLLSTSTPPAPRAAVIVPIYNVESYLQECLDSIYAQTIFEDLEVILVEDGSSDSSPKIAREFSEQHPNVKYVTKENGGLGAARNTGLGHVEAPFVGFLDSDDVLPSDAYEKLTLALERDATVDVAVGGMQTFPKATDYHWARAFSAGARRLESVADAPPLIHSASACNKLFRVSTWHARGDSFPERMHFEDAWTVVPYLLEARAVAIVNGLVYWYRKREVGGSIMDSLFTRPGNYWDYLKLIEHLGQTACAYMPAEKALAHAFIVRGFQGFLLRAESYLEDPELRAFYERAYRVVAEISPRIIEKNTLSLPLKLAFGRLLLMGERDVYRMQVDPVSMVGEKPHYGNLGLGNADGLLKSAGFTASLEGVSLRKKHVVLEGRITARGIPVDIEPDIEISIGLGRRRFKASWVERVDRPVKEGAWSAFRARIPLGKWPLGEYFPRLVLKAELGQASPRMMKTAALFRNGRSFVTDGFAYSVSANKKNQAAITKKALPQSRAFGAFKILIGDLSSSGLFGRRRALARILRRTSRKDTWLIGERWDYAQDNGAALFRYLSNNSRRGVRPVYVLDKDAPAFRSLSKQGRVVAHGSWRHKLELMRATRMISAFDVDTYLIPKNWDKAEYLEQFQGPLGTKRVFLQHGVTSRTLNAKNMHRLVVGYDLVVTSSTLEQKYFAEELGYGKRAVATGMPRLDALERTYSFDRKIILFAPTWRPGLVVPSYNSKGRAEDRGNFENSAYFRTIKSIIESPELAAMLKSANAEFRFLPHYEAAEFFAGELDWSDRVKMADLEERNFQDWLRFADAFITDYSSSSFDVALMGTPIVYLDDTEDLHREPTRSGAFFNAETDGFGPAVEGVSELVTALSEIIDNDYVMTPRYRDNVKRFFAGIRIGSCASATSSAIASI